MGVLNVTPDSFYPESRAFWEGRDALDETVRRGLRLAAEGADILDIGGQSTRPGSEPVPEEEESRRVVAVIERLAPAVRIPISVDTSKASVAKAARAAGASILNDVTALRGDPAMAEAALEYPEIILMHMQGTPKTMQQRPTYGDVVADVLSFFQERLGALRRLGVSEARVLLDPGIGFGKDLGHNLEILRRLEEFRVLGRPLVIGASRKSFIGRILAASEGTADPLGPEERLEGSLAVACRAAAAGASVVRVHDVRATRRALEVWAKCSGPRHG